MMMGQTFLLNEVHTYGIGFYMLFYARIPNLQWKPADFAPEKFFLPLTKKICNVFCDFSSMMTGQTFLLNEV